MKKQSRLIILLLAGTLGLTPFSGMAMASSSEEGARGARSKVPMGVTVGVGVASIVAAFIVAHFVGKEIKKRLVRREMKKLRTQFPDYRQDALEFAAVVYLSGGLAKFIQKVVWDNVIKLKNPKRALRLLVQDEQQVNAIAFAVKKTPEQVRNAFENPSIARAVLSPF